ncbi:MAG: RraA family protein, partial [Candidatus Acidiferrales bacterium]
MIKQFCRMAIPAALLLACAIPASAQLGLFSTEQRIAFTPDWHGERFPDGRPKVPEAVLERLKDTDAEQAWDMLQ